MINFYIPSQFIPQILSGEYVRYGAILKHAVTGEIIGHLKEAGNLSSLLSAIPSNPIEAANFIVSNGQLFKIQDTLNALQLVSSVGAVASVLNLGVTIAGFAIVINKLNRIENKVDSVLQISKEIKAKLEFLDIKMEYLLFAKIKTAIEKIETAEITLDNGRRIDLLHESNSSLREMKNYFRIFIQNMNPVYLSDFSENDYLNLYQRYFSAIYGVIQTEFILQDSNVCRKEISDFSIEIKNLIESFDSKKMFRARSDFYKKHESLTILNHSSQLEKAKIETENFKSIMNETLARVESLTVELDYLEKSKLTYAQYINEIQSMSDDIILIPKINELRKKPEDRNKSSEVMKERTTKTFRAKFGYSLVAAGTLFGFVVLGVYIFYK